MAGPHRMITYADAQRIFSTHYVLMRYADSAELEWYKFVTKPGHLIVSKATQIIRHNKDGSLEYVKDRNGDMRPLTEQETKDFLFVLLAANRI